MLFWLLLMFLLGYLNLIIKMNHIMVVVMSLELILILNLINLAMMMSSFLYSNFFLFYLSMMVGDGCFTLSLVVYFIRANNSDQFDLISLLKF